jgi:hypothetical protein
MSPATSPTDLFELIGQETRMSILQALVEQDKTSDDPVLPFSELKRQAAIEDTGRFNYHLGELLESLVVRTDDGYRLSKFGRRVLRPMATGFYDPNLEIDDLNLPGACPDCGGSLHVRLSENVMQVVCSSDHIINYGLLGSPGLVAEHPPEDARTALGLLSTHAVELGTAGVCPVCHGRTDGGIERMESMDCYVFRAPCESCGNEFMTPVGGCVDTHPEVVELYADHEIDLRSTVPWRHPFRRPGDEEVVSRDPLRVGVLVGDELPDDSLYITLTRSGGVHSINRMTA